MTALPKHWPSSRRQGRRRSNIHARALTQTVNCKHCNSPKVPGFQCPNCHQ